MKFKEYAVGDKVKYTRKFLKSIGTRATDPMWFAEGTVVELTPFGKESFWPKVLWAGEAESCLIHPNNIGKSGSLSLNID